MYLWEPIINIYFRFSTSINYNIEIAVVRMLIVNVSEAKAFLSNILLAVIAFLVAKIVICK